MERYNWIPNEAFGISDEQAQEWVAGQDYCKPEAWEHFTPEFIGTKAQTLNLDAALQHLDKGQRLFQEARLSQNEGKAIFKSDHPITLFAIGDVHLGSIYTDHRKFMEDMEAIKKTPGAYIVFMSNLIDNALPKMIPDSMLANTMPPDKQVITMRKIVEDLNGAGKILAAVTSPCHEGFTYRVCGQDVNAMIFGFPERRFPVLENGGRLTLEFPGWQRTVGLYHMTGPFESNFSPTHATKQMNRLRQNMECDIVVAAHKHVGDAEDVWQGTGECRKPIAYLRSGCYKGTGEIHDQWAVGRLAVTGDPGGESVTILPREKLQDAHLQFETGILAQKAYLAQHFV